MIVKDADLIRRLMEAKTPKMTARALARAMGWSSHTYAQRIVRGEVRTVTTDSAVKIAYLLGVPVDLIFVARESGKAGDSVRRTA